MAMYRCHIRRIMFRLILSCCLIPLSAQDTITYDIHSGLSHWITTGILQDRQGFIWIATWNGLNRYDGYEFKQIKAMPGDSTSIKSEVIRSFYLDHEGNIICKTDEDIFKFNTKTYKLEDVPPAMEFSPDGNFTTVTDNEGNQWEVKRYGISKIVQSHHPAKIVNGTEKVQARAFLLDNKRRWWLATKEDGCIRIFNHENKFIGFLSSDGSISKEKASFGYRAYSITQVDNGDIWIGCKPGALLRLREGNSGCFDIKRIRHEQLTCDIIYHIAEDPDGRLWLATFGGGAQCILNADSDSPEAINFFSDNGFCNGANKVRRILTTKSGNIACATTKGLVTGTINKDDIRKSTFKRFTRDGVNESSLSNNATTDIISDNNGNIFIATETSGIDVITEDDLFYGSQPAFMHYNTSNSSLTSNSCLALTLKDNNRIIAVCTDRVMEFIPACDSTVTYSKLFWNKACHFSEERPLQLPDQSWLFGQEQGAYIATKHSLTTSGNKQPLVFTELQIEGRQPQLDICTKDTIYIDHNGRNFSIGFAALDFTDNSGILYHSRLDGSPWSHANATRSLTFHNIGHGWHTLEVQSTDRYGRWVNNSRLLTIYVIPKWHETAWAKIIGCLLIVAILTVIIYTIFYIRSLHRQRHELLLKYMEQLHTGSDEKKTDTEADCRNHQPSQLSDDDRRFMERVMKYIEINIANADANIEEMANYTATSKSTLNRRLHSIVGITAAQLIIEARIKKAMQMLDNVENGRLNIAEIAYKCGYSDPRYFTRTFKQKYGMPPSVYVANKNRSIG